MESDKKGKKISSGVLPNRGNGKLSKRERDRKIKAIYREMEAKKRELGLRAPVIKKGPVFYGVMVMVLLLIGGAIVQIAGGEKAGGRRLGDGRPVRAQRSVDALAEALGRYRFHCGVYPTEAEGLQALSDKFSEHAGWMGPYVGKIVRDPWKRDYVYECPAKEDELPVVMSLGADGIRGTDDDILPAPDLFLKPFKDTTWTNDWAPFTMRGIIVVPTKEEKEALQRELDSH